MFLIIFSYLIFNKEVGLIEAHNVTKYLKPCKILVEGSLHIDIASF